MSQSLICPLGHRWSHTGDQNGASQLCPVCGRAATGPRDPPAPNATLAESAPDPRGGGVADTRPMPEQPLRGEEAAPVRFQVQGPIIQRDDVSFPTLPGYTILAELGRGGMGVVYKARQVMLGRLVALKMVLTGEDASPQERLRFLAEAEAVAQLQHPNIVQIYEIGEHEGWPYISLEFVDGGTLAQRLLRGPPYTPRAAAELVEALARAIHVAHERGIIHRDLKPANVLLTADGTPKITDFGLVKRLDAGIEHLRAGTVMGTPSFMAPEQAAGRTHEIGPAADVYALGAILYAALTGRAPFRAETPTDTLLLVMTGDLLPPSRLQPGIPRDLETVCLKCLEKHPARRYASALELAADLRRILHDEPIHARPVGSLGRLWRWCRRRPVQAAVTATLALLLPAALVLAGSLALTQAVALERLRAEQEETRAALQEAQAQAAAALQQRRLLSGLLLERGLALCERGDVARGLLWLAHALERAPADAADLQRVARINLAAWREEPRPLAAVPGHEAAPTATATSPDGTIAARVGPEGTVRLVDLATGQPLGPALGRPGEVRGVAFSSDGKALVAVSADGATRAWPVPPPLGGEPAQLALWVEVHTGLTLDGAGVVRRRGEPGEARP